MRFPTRQTAVSTILIALLTAGAGGILCLSSIVARPPASVANSSARNLKLGTRNAKLEIGKSKLVGLDVSKVEPAARTRLVKNYGRLPLRFEANQGQTDGRVNFISRGRGYTMFLTGDEAVLSLRGESQKANVKRQMAKVEGHARPLLPSLFPSSDTLANGATHNPQLTTHNPRTSNRQSSIPQPPVSSA